MTHDKFKTLCQRVLVPMLGDLLFRHLTTVHEDIDAIARELVRLNNKLDILARKIGRDPGA